jgi:hypothetical protein
MEAYPLVVVAFRNCLDPSRTRGSPMEKQTALGLGEMPVITRALYGSAAVLALLIGAHAATGAVQYMAGSAGDLRAAFAPDGVMGVLLAGLAGVGWLGQRLARRKQRTTAPA